MTGRYSSSKGRTTLFVCLALVASATLVWQFQLGLELSLSVADSSSLSSNLVALEWDRPVRVDPNDPTTPAVVQLEHPAAANSNTHNNNKHKNNKTVWWPRSLIHDETLEWDSHVYRPWLDPNAPSPPAVILLTSFGWNHVNQKWDLTIPRSIRERELFTGVINHPWFHPTLWEELDQAQGNLTSTTTKLPPNTPIYIFLDRQQCGDSNYPVYGGVQEPNMDVQFGRPWKPYSGRTPFDNPLLSSLTFKELRSRHHSFQATAILFNCDGGGIPGFWNPYNRITGSLANASYLSIATLSSLISRVKEDRDQGLAPPIPKPVNLTDTQVQDIHTCAAENNRPFYFVYAGNFRSGDNADFNRRHGGARGSYRRFNDNRRIVVSRYFNRQEFNQSALSNYSYQDFMARAVFALAARGDNKFSYRFTEVLSAGAIPVVHADDWVWPFRPEVINWTECAVILPEKDAGNTTLAYLDTISLEQRCRMRQACYRIYKDYVETTVGTINGLVQGLERVQTQQQGGGSLLKLQGVRCDEFANASRDCNLQR